MQSLLNNNNNKTNREAFFLQGMCTFSYPTSPNAPIHFKALSYDSLRSDRLLQKQTDFDCTIGQYRVSNENDARWRPKTLSNGDVIVCRTAVPESGRGPWKQRSVLNRPLRPGVTIALLSGGQILDRSDDRPNNSPCEGRHGGPPSPSARRMKELNVPDG